MHVYLQTWMVHYRYTQAYVLQNRPVQGYAVLVCLAVVSEGHAVAAAHTKTNRQSSTVDTECQSMTHSVSI
jgi:hypothetical protein